MSFSPPGAMNPFEPPRAGIGERFSDPNLGATDVELIRRAHLSHEASVKSIGSLYYLGAIIGLIQVAYRTYYGDPTLAALNLSPEALQATKIGQFVGGFLTVLLQFGLGYGLSNLQTWARWTSFAFTVIGLILIPLAGLGAMMVNPVIGVVMTLVGETILGYVAYLLVSPKGGVVFSRGYKSVIAQTPHIKYRTSIILKIFLVLILLLIIAGVIGALVSRR